ncbi:MAG: hypothetical protein U0457_12305 [Candidatus Sericytochromatia bacterium]
MSAVKDYRLELTDFEEVALEMKLKEIAVNLHKLGIEKEKISQATKLSIEEVEEIIKSMPREE